MAKNNSEIQRDLLREPSWDPRVTLTGRVRGGEARDAGGGTLHTGCPVGDGPRGRSVEGIFPPRSPDRSRAADLSVLRQRASRT
jgi:hypothetical protein